VPKRFWLLFLATLFLLDGIVGWWWWRRQRERRYDPQILRAAARYGIEPALVKAVVWRESRFDAEAKGAAGELGLMQVRPGVVQEWGLAEHLGPIASEQVMHPLTNILIGSWYLKKLMSRYPLVDNPIPYGLSDYNAGRQHTLRWGQGMASTNSAQFVAQIGYPGTRLYVQEVLQRRMVYQTEFAGQRSR
jgi:soluble lytic murein transglycosylase